MITATHLHRQGHPRVADSRKAGAAAIKPTNPRFASLAHRGVVESWVDRTVGPEDPLSRGGVYKQRACGATDSRPLSSGERYLACDQTRPASRQSRAWQLRRPRSGNRTVGPEDPLSVGGMYERGRAARRIGVPAFVRRDVSRLRSDRAPLVARSRAGRIASCDPVRLQAAAPETGVRRGWPAWPSGLRNRPISKVPRRGPTIAFAIRPARGGRSQRRRRGYYLVPTSG